LSFILIVEIILYDGEKSYSFRVSSSGKTYSISSQEATLPAFKLYGIFFHQISKF